MEAYIIQQRGRLNLRRPFLLLPFPVYANVPLHTFWLDASDVQIPHCLIVIGVQRTVVRVIAVGGYKDCISDDCHHYRRMGKPFSVCRDLNQVAGLHILRCGDLGTGAALLFPSHSKNR